MTTWDPSNKDSSITLSNGNLTASGTISNAFWHSVIATGPGKTSGKWYWRNKCIPVAGSWASGAVSNGILPPNNYIGSDANGWIGYAQPGNSMAYQHINIVIGGSGPVFSAIGDYIVSAYDADNGAIYFTAMTAAGSLNTNWNGTNANPAGNIGGFSVTAGTALMPGASIFDASGAGDQINLDTTTAIHDNTLLGFSTYDLLALTLVPSHLGGASIWNHAVNVTPSDVNVLPAETDYLSFINGGSQTIRITTFGGETFILTDLASGVLHPIRAKRVWASGTTVTAITAYWL